MKGIVVTEKNYNEIRAKLSRFFKHKEFVVWHCFKGGMRKRIRHYVRFNKYNSEAIDVMRKYYNVRFISECNDHYCGIRMDSQSGFVILPGDVILFLGNRIIHRGEFPVPVGGGKRYCYMCFQIM